MSGLIAVWLALVLWLLAVTVGQTSQADINAACAKHKGVASYTDTTFSATKGGGTAVCRDGVAVVVNP